VIYLDPSKRDLRLKTLHKSLLLHQLSLQLKTYEPRRQLPPLPSS